MRICDFIGKNRGWRRTVAAPPGCLNLNGVIIFIRRRSIFKIEPSEMECQGFSPIMTELIAKCRETLVMVS